MLLLIIGASLSVSSLAFLSACLWLAIVRGPTEPECCQHQPKAGDIIMRPKSDWWAQTAKRYESPFPTDGNGNPLLRILRGPWDE